MRFSVVFSRARRTFVSVCAIGLSASFGLSACSGGSSTTPPFVPSANQQALQGLQSKINHIIVIYQENWGFDSLYGNFPGANGYSQSLAFAQVDANGKPLTAVPPPLKNNVPDPSFPATLPPAPFNLASFVSTSYIPGDPNHNFYIQQAEIDGGKMDRYLAYPPSNAGGYTFGYWDATQLPEGQIAKAYTLADNFAQSAFGGSFINNFWMACACTAQYPGALPTTPGVVEQYDASGNPIMIGSSEGRITNDGYIVNTSFTTQYPQITASTKIVPPQTATTIGDRLSAANVSWAWYSGGFNNALAGNPDPTFQAHHQPYLYFANYAPGTPAMQAHLKDETDFFAAVANGTLPSVSWLKPVGANNEHPGYTNIITGQTYVANVINQIQQSKIWKDSLIIIVYDEAGGHYDHVAPTPVDRWGPSTRVPAIFVSPFIKPNYVDHTKYETMSILTTIEARFNLQPLNARDAAATPILAPFDFTRATPQAYERRTLGTFPALPATPTSRFTRPVTELNDNNIDE